MNLTVSKSTAKAMKGAIGFLLFGCSDKETHSRIDPENAKLLGVTKNQIFDLIRLRDQINEKLK